MGFLKSVAKVISAPVTVPLKVASNVIDNVAPDNPVTKAVSNAFAAPFELVQKGGSFGDVVNQVRPALSLAAPALAGADLGLAGGLVSSLLKQPQPSTTNPYVYTTGDVSSSSGYDSSYIAQEDAEKRKRDLIFYAAAGGAVLFVILVTRRK